MESPAEPGVGNGGNQPWAGWGCWGTAGWKERPKEGRPTRAGVRSSVLRSDAPPPRSPEPFARSRTTLFSRSGAQKPFKLFPPLGLRPLREHVPQPHRPSALGVRRLPATSPGLAPGAGLLRALPSAAGPAPTPPGSRLPLSVN